VVNILRVGLGENLGHKPRFVDDVPEEILEGGKHLIIDE